MGGFQAVMSGLGETGEQAGQGINNAINEALRVRQQTHQEDIDAAHIDLAAKAQQQQYLIFQQQHELAKQQLEASGWKDMGVTVGPDGRYVRNFYNEQTQQKRAVGVQGVPPDSSEGMLNHFKTLSSLKDQDNNPLFTPLQAKQIAFKMPQLYREGPVGMLDGFTDYAKEKNDSGISAIQVPGFGKIDITSPEGQAKFGQTMLDTIYQRSLMAAMYKSQHPGDASGWTANEKREYDAVNNKNKALEQLYLKFAESQMAQPSAMNPETQEEIKKSLMSSVLPLYSENQSKEEEINARHNRTAPTSVPGQGGPPAGAPSAKGLPDNTPLLQNGKPSGFVAKGGQWVHQGQ